MIDRSTSSSALAIVVVCFILAAAIVAAGRQPEQVTIQPRALPAVMIISTPLPTADTTALQQELAVLRTRIAELERERQAPVVQPVSAPAEAPIIQVENAQPTAAPGGYVAHTTEGDVFVPDNATPVPNDGSYSGPFLAPVTTEQPSGPRLCTGFHDARDYDPLYQSSPVCRQP